MEEIWKDVPGYENMYAASNTGKIWSKYYKREITGSLDKDGYLNWTCSKKYGAKHLKFHKVVMLTFVGPCPDGMQVRHLNGNKSNNSIGNLEYGFPKENAADRILHETQVRGSSHPLSKITESQARQVKIWLRDNWPCPKIANNMGISLSIVEKIKSGTTWKHVSLEDQDV